MNSAFIRVCRKQPCEGEGLTSRYSTQTQKMKEMREEGREEWVVGSGVAKGGQKGPSFSLSLLSTMAQKPKPSFSNGIIPSVSSGSLFTDFLYCVFPLHETADMRASHQHVVPAPFFFLSRPGCFRRPVRGPNLLSVYCQPSLLSWDPGGPFQAGQAAWRRQGHTTAL